MIFFKMNYSKKYLSHFLKCIFTNGEFIFGRAYIHKITMNNNGVLKRGDWLQRNQLQVEGQLIFWHEVMHVYF